MALPICSLGTEQLTNSTCNTEESGRIATVTRVIDGDTVIISTGDHVRLIGIDTPEIDYKSGKTEAGAIAARDALQAMIAGQQQVLLVFDQQRVDQYGRTLAHLFLADGTNVQARLLALGLAVPFPYPPDLKFVDCYHEASTAAISGAPIIMGNSQFANPTVPGITTPKTIIKACIVVIELKNCGSTYCRPGAINSARITMAMAPPTKNMNKEKQRYKVPISL